MLMALCLFSATAYTPGVDMRVTVIGKTNYAVKAPVVRARSPSIAASIIPEAKPEKPILIKSPKPNAGVRKCWRTTRGTKKYRLRKVCRQGERTRP